MPDPVKEKEETVVKTVKLKTTKEIMKEFDAAAKTLEDELLLKISSEQLMSLCLESSLKTLKQDRIVKVFQAKVKGL